VTRQSPPGNRAWPQRRATIANLVSPGARMRPTAGFIVTGTAVDWCVTFRTCDRRCTVFLLLFFSSSPPPPPPFPSVCNFVRNPLSPPVCVSRRIEIEAVESYTQCASRRVIINNPCVWFVRAYFPSVINYYNIIVWFARNTTNTLKSAAAPAMCG